MEEKILIKSEINRVIGIVCLVLGIYCLVAAFRLSSVFFEYDEFTGWVILVSGTGVGLISTLSYFFLCGHELTVTDRRIYGKVAWGKRVDLPIDSVSAIATVSFLKGVAVSTSSGRICFLMIKNSDEIYKVISSLLVERQNEKNIVPETVVQKRDEADMLKKYKALLDDGTITQEEFEAKKKQLMGL